jgi:hypothetical protein
MRTVRSLIPSALLCAGALAVGGCDGADMRGEGTGSLTEGEARALDDAASMLDEERLPDGALPDVEPDGDGASPQDQPQQTAPARAH